MPSVNSSTSDLTTAPCSFPRRPIISTIDRVKKFENLLYARLQHIFSSFHLLSTNMRGLGIQLILASFVLSLIWKHATSWKFPLPFHAFWWDFVPARSLWNDNHPALLFVSWLGCAAKGYRLFGIQLTWAWSEICWMWASFLISDSDFWAKFLIRSRSFISRLCWFLTICSSIYFWCRSLAFKRFSALLVAISVSFWARSYS